MAASNHEILARQSEERQEVAGRARERSARKLPGSRSGYGRVEGGQEAAAEAGAATEFPPRSERAGDELLERCGETLRFFLFFLVLGT